MTAPAAPARISWGRLLLAEMRKLSLSPGMLWTLGGALVTICAFSVYGQVRSLDAIAYSASLGTLVAFLMFALPLIGATIGSDDFDSGEVQTFFVLEPARWRHLVAKTVVTLALGVVVVAVTMVAAALMAWLLAVTTGRDLYMQVGVEEALRSLLPTACVGLLMGIGWGMLIQRFGLTVLLVLGQAFVLSPLMMLLPWGLGPYVSSLSIGGYVEGQSSLLQFLTSFSLWCVLPFVLAFVRVHRQQA